jgi:hypothetical protein
MRSIDKKSIPVPPILLDANTQVALQTLISTSKKERKDAIKSEIYKGTVAGINTVTVALKVLYHYKKVGRGAATIKICNLQRQNLVVLRQMIIIDVLKNALDKDIKAFLDKDIDGNALKKGLKSTFDSFHKKQQPNQVFSLYAKYTYENFDKILLPLFSKNQQIILKNAFVAYKNGDL